MAKVPATSEDAKRPSKAAPPESALQRRPSVIELGVRRGGFESGLLKIGRVLCCFSKPKLQELLWEFPPLTRVCEYLLLRCRERGAQYVYWC